MAGKLIYMAPIENASGKIFGKKERFISVKRSFGNKQKGCAVSGTRNLMTHPVTENEKAQRDSFKAAAALRKLVIDTPSKKASWMERFQEQDKYATLNGYIMAMAMKGHVSATGDWE